RLHDLRPRRCVAVLDPLIRRITERGVLLARALDVVDRQPRARHARDATIRAPRSPAHGHAMTSSDSARVTRPAPRGTLATPYPGRPPLLTERQWRVMALVSVAVLFDQYDLSLLSLALKQIQAELSLSEADLGSVGAFVRLGALPSFLIVMLADVIGRRGVMLATIVVYTLITGLTAFVPDAKTFMW